MENKNMSEIEKAAELTRKECIKTALEAYETATQNGICHEGAWECAVDAMRSFKIEDLIQKLLSSKE